MTLRTQLRRLALALLVVLLCALPGLAVEPAPAAAAARSPYVALGSVTPKAPMAKDTVRITGKVHNPSKNPLADLKVRLRILRTPLSSRELVKNVAAAGDQPTGTPIYGRDANVGRVGRGGSGAFRLEVPAESLGLYSFGVYAVAIEAFQADGTSVAIQRTFLVYTPDKRSLPKPTKVGWVMPVVDRPHKELGNIFANDRLATSMSENGRLGRLARAGIAANAGKVPVTWAIDPALLDEADTMRAKYRYRSEGEVVDGNGGLLATDFLDTLKSATENQSVLSLPYGDVDTAALARAGLSTDVTAALTQGEEVTSDVLGVTSEPGLNWPPGGQLDQQGLDVLASNRTRTAILEDTAMPLAEELSYTPHPVATTRTSSGSVKVLLSDSRITDILESAKDRPGSAALTEQRFLAETALITAERPNAPRGLVVAPPRRWNPPGELASNLFTHSAQVPWLAPTPLAKLRETEPPEELTRRGLAYGGGARRAELSRAHLKRVRELHGSLDRFSSIFNPLPDRIRDYNLAVLRTESAAWRTDRRRGRALLSSIATSVARQRAQVRILTNNRQLTLASSDGSVPLTIENNLSSPVTVRLRVSSANERRMRVGDLPENTEVGPRQKTTVQVPMRAASSGVIELDTQLLTPDGKPYSQPVTFNVRSTVYGSVAVIITVSALIVLFTGAGYRVVRRVLRARRHKLDHADEATG